jgi:xanthine dehydrogenase accessory factor
MLVSAARTWGTIGGGALEFQAVEQARRVLDLPPGTWRIQDYPLGPLLGQCCGGRVRLLVEHLDAQSLAPLQACLKRAGLKGRCWSAISAPRASIGTGLPRASRPRFRRGGQARGGNAGDRAGGAMAPPGLSVRRRPCRPGDRPPLPGLPLRLCWFDTRPMFASLDGVTVVPRRTSSPAWPKRRTRRPS